MPHSRTSSTDTVSQGLAKPINQTAVAIDNDKNSPYAVRYAIETLLASGSSIILIHVSVPKLDPQNPGGSAGDGNSETTDLEIQQLFTRFKAYCARKRITVIDVVLNDADISKALVEYITENAIANVVLGASTRSALARKFRNSNVPSTLMKSVPDFCSVYVIGKGKVHERRLATRTLANHAAPPKISSFSDAEDGDRALPLRGDQRCASEKIRPAKSSATKSMDNIELPTRGVRCASASNIALGEDSDFAVPLTFGSVDVTGHDLDFGIAAEFNEAKSPKLTSARDIEAEMRRLKLELQQTMSMYNAACKEAVSAKKQASELRQYQMEEARRFEQARLAEEAAREIVEMEKAKCKAAMEAAEKAKKLAQMEAQRRRYAELKAKREAEEKNRALSVLSNNHVRYRKYTIEEIEEATNEFEASLRLGEGGYGPVYKGKLDHTLVAIKVLRPDAAQGKKQFQQEVEVLSRMRHPNLVLLLGACPEYGCLVYEYMNYGSLEDRLSRKGNTPSIPWQIRFRIAADIATGLLFLHQAKPEPLVHRDLKPGNILLDRNYVCKIADIGLARLVPSSVADSVTQYHMTSAAGTFCYIDPEYQQTGMLGVKSDIYSLGVMLLQIITGRPPMGLTHYVQRAISKGTFADMLDPTVPDWPVEEALSFAKLAIMCTELRKKDRPDLGSVILPELNRLKDIGESNRSSKDGRCSPGSDSWTPSNSRTPSPRQSSPLPSQERRSSSYNYPTSSE